MSAPLNLQLRSTRAGNDVRRKRVPEHAGEEVRGERGCGGARRVSARTRAGETSEGLGEQARVVRAGENGRENKRANTGWRKQACEIDGAHVSRNRCSLSFLTLRFYHIPKYQPP